MPTQTSDMTTSTTTSRYASPELAPTRLSSLAVVDPNVPVPHVRRVSTQSVRQRHAMCQRSHGRSLPSLDLPAVGDSHNEKPQTVSSRNIPQIRVMILSDTIGPLGGVDRIIGWRSSPGPLTVWSSSNKAGSQSDVYSWTREIELHRLSSSRSSLPHNNHLHLNTDPFLCCLADESRFLLALTTRAVSYLYINN